MSTIISGSGDSTFGGTIQSTGIDDNATSTTITIDSAEHVSFAHGIGFNGDTAAANALDDYEEGTWSSAVVTQSSRTGAVITDGKYTKIGNVVVLTGKYTATVTTTTSEVSLDFNLPFAMSSYLNGITGVATGLVGSGSSRFYVMGAFSPTSSHVRCSFYGRAGSIAQTGSDIGQFTVTYRT